MDYPAAPIIEAIKVEADDHAADEGVAGVASGARVTPFGGSSPPADPNNIRGSGARRLGVATISPSALLDGLRSTPAWLGFCFGNQPQRELLTEFLIAYLNSHYLRGLLLVFAAWLRSVFCMILKNLLDVGAERSPIFLSKLFKLGL
jgi:hypothetical protein